MFVFRTRHLLVAVALAAACGGGGGEDAGASGDVDLARGEQLFAANCAACHGPEGQGTTAGPPLVHEIYEPGHHPDEAFHRAVQEGVPAHHWNSGDMPPIGGLDRDDVDDVVAWVREVQREAGIG
ncbi:c-type cytochrome [Egicoccus halophilus]|uniref:Cytochrome c domain-containing protein n=1 Tax=Egicoccus halophilus TaxID=1670830 RepID=A0A8J3EYL6_9ACTN|nr:cytochrome c [Egicoccus halophilus]GGI08112.1 hypothetical protein GCM10011354_27470 [Egicoccus halophilus]